MKPMPEVTLRTAGGPFAPGLDLVVVVPVLNEERVLARSVSLLVRHLDTLGLATGLLIADNGSTDATLEIAAGLAERYPTVGVLGLRERGRGRALRAAWNAVDAKVVMYTDVDLSTDIEHIRAMYELVVNGSDLVFGSRSAEGSRTTRGPWRSFVSFAYRNLVFSMFDLPVTDLQCGFKALRGDVARELSSAAQDDSWFFDTEICMLAHWSGFSISELPVTWVDDPDSRVHVANTARANIVALNRMLEHPQSPPARTASQFLARTFIGFLSRRIAR